MWRHVAGSRYVVPWTPSLWPVAPGLEPWAPFLLLGPWAPSWSPGPQDPQAQPQNPLRTP